MIHRTRNEAGKAESHGFTVLPGKIAVFLLILSLYFWSVSFFQSWSRLSAFEGQRAQAVPKERPKSGVFLAPKREEF